LNQQGQVLTPATLAEAESRIHALVKSTYVDPTGRAEAILDGVINFDRYCAASCRVMWILKEPLDGENSSGGGWNLAGVLDEKPVSELGQATFHPIIYIAYGLFNDLTSFDAMPWMRYMEDPEGVLRRLAFVNVKKLPGVTRGAYGPTIMAWYSKGRNIIMEQLKAYRPDIVFGCAPHFPVILDNIIGGWRNRVRSVGSAEYVWHEKTLFVHVYHPGQTQITRDEYVDDALNAVAQARREKNIVGQRKED
jgi:hypothetical protein